MNIRTATRHLDAPQHTLRIYSKENPLPDGKGKFLASVKGAYQQCVKNASVHYPKEKFIWVWDK